MTTTLFLVRHGSHGRLGRMLCGRMPGVELGQEGQAEAQALGRRFAGEQAVCVLSSPLERAQQTAGPIAQALGLSVRTEPDANELDFGDWTGLSFEELHADPEWARWNRIRLQSRPPGGESLLECQVRVLRVLDRACAEHPDGGVVVVAHADPIKAALAHFLGLALDFHDRFEIGPASVSVVAVGDWGSKVMSMNEAVRP